MAANAWSNIKNTTLEKAWRKLSMHQIEEITEQERIVEANIEEAVTTLSRILGSDCDCRDVIQ